MKYTLFSTMLVMLFAAAPVVQSTQVTLENGVNTTECNASVIEMSGDVLRVICDSAPTTPVDPAPPPDGGDSTPPTPTPTPPQTSTPPGDGAYLGQTLDGTWKTASQELAGEVEGTLMIPSIAEVHTIVYEGGNSETVYPGCAGMIINGQREWRDCKGNGGSLDGSTTYVQRLRVERRDEPLEPRVEMKARETDDELGEYDFSVSLFPGDLDPIDAGCQSKGQPGATFYLNKDWVWACDGPVQKLSKSTNTNLYANFRAAGDKADDCSTQLTCQIYLRAW